MHVLTAAHDLYPDPGAGGTGRYVYETARRLVDHDHRVSVITRRRGGVPHRECLDGIDVCRYDIEIANRNAPAVFAQLPTAMAAVGRAVSELNRRDPPDLVSAQGPVTAALLDRHVADDVPRVPTFHSPWPTEYRIRTRQVRGRLRAGVNSAIRRWIEGSILARADHVVTLSEFMRDELVGTYGHDVPVSVIPGGVDVEHFSPDATTGGGRGMDGGDPTFLTVRRLAERMGHGLLVEAFGTVVERVPEARLNVVGDGPIRSSLERRVSNRGLDEHVQFLGYLADGDLPGVYAAADVFVLPTTALEGFGLATLEALASGLPVVATPIGGTVEVVADLARDPALPVSPLVESVDPDAIAEGMCAWAEVSPRAMVETSTACRRYVAARYPWERTVAQLESLYRAVVG